MAYCFTRGRAAATLFLTTALAACSTEGLAPSARIDDTARVGSISPPAQPRRAVAVQSAAIAAAPSVETYPPSSMPVPEEGVNMDEGLGVQPEAESPAAGPRVVGLAEEEASYIAEGATSQPVVGGIGTSTPTLVAPPPVVSPSSPAGGHMQQVALLRPDNPVMRDAPPMSEMPAALPASEQACRAQLRRIGVIFRDVPRIEQGPNCSVPYPIKVTGMPDGVGINETTLNCQVTLAFAKWVDNEVVPSARARYFSGVARIETLGGYSCRRMNSRSSNPWSEHAHGNAVDIGTIVLKNGKEIDVRKKGFFAFREKGLLKAVRTDSCRYFSTVLGPGSDPDHWNHFHFDLRAHKAGYRHCD